MAQIILILLAFIGAIVVVLFCVYFFVELFYWIKRKLHIFIIIRNTHIQLNDKIYAWSKNGLKNSKGTITTFEEILENRWIKRKNFFFITIFESR